MNATEQDGGMKFTIHDIPQTYNALNTVQFLKEQLGWTIRADLPIYPRKGQGKGNNTKRTFKLQVFSLTKPKSREIYVGGDIWRITDGTTNDTTTRRPAPWAGIATSNDEKYPALGRQRAPMD